MSSHDRFRSQTSKEGRRFRVSYLRDRVVRLRRRMRANPLLYTAWRVVIFVVGWTVVLFGIALLVLPGPGWLTIFIGLGILATEFMWARHVLRKAKGLAERATERALDPRVRRRNQIYGSALVVLLVLGLAVYVWRFGVPFLSLAVVSR